MIDEANEDLQVDDTPVDDKPVEDTPTEDSPAEPVVAAKEWSDQDEAEAKAFGWKSADEWRGEKPPGYIEDPRAYTDRLDNFKPFAKMKERLDTFEATAAEESRKMAVMNQRALDDQRGRYESQMADLTTTQRKAVEEADTEAFDRAEAQRGALIKQNQTADVPAQAAPDPYVASYETSEEGKWMQNPILRKAAFDYVGGNPAVMAMPAKLQVEYAERMVRENYAPFFPAPEKPKPKPIQKVDGGGLAGAGKSSQFDGLPSDAKAAFKRFMAEGLYEGLYKDTDTAKRAYANEYHEA